MLIQIETIEAPKLEQTAQTQLAESPLAGLCRKPPIWVYSKSQPPYEFHPWMDPCVPHEWPYDLQALRGTEDYLDIIEWFLARHPDVPREDLLRYELELARCVGDRLQISVEGYNDIDTGKKELVFTVWGLPPGVYGRDFLPLKDFYAIWFSTPELAALWQVVTVWTSEGRFEERDHG